MLFEQWNLGEQETPCTNDRRYRINLFWVKCYIILEKIKRLCKGPSFSIVSFVFLYRFTNFYEFSFPLLLSVRKIIFERVRLICQVTQLVMFHYPRFSYRPYQSVNLNFEIQQVESSSCMRRTSRLY